MEDFSCTYLAIVVSIGEFFPPVNFNDYIAGASADGWDYGLVEKGMLNFLYPQVQPLDSI